MAQLYNLDLWYIIPLQKLKCPKNSSPACAPLSFTALGQELLYGNFGVWGMEFVLCSLIPQGSGASEFATFCKMLGTRAEMLNLTERFSRSGGTR